MPRLTLTNVIGQDVAVGNADGYGKSFTVPPAGLVVDLTGGQLSSDGPQLEALKNKGYITYVITQNPNVSDELELMSGAPQAIVMPAVVPAAKSATAIHASVLATAANLFPGPLTNPAAPRNLSAVSAAGYDGGILTIVGTNTFDQAQTELITPNPAGGTVFGTKIFKTVSSVTKATIGVAAFGVSVGTGDKIGVPWNVANTAGMMFVGGVLEPVTIDATNDGWTATSVPNGVLSFVAVLNIQAA